MSSSTIITPSVARVPLHTATAVNRQIRDDAAKRVAYFHAHPDAVGRRLQEINEEWDVERALATGSSCLSLLGMALAFNGRPRWAYLTLAVQAFYLQHTLRGWCPPLPILRRLGFRTPMEIEQERCALKGVREEVAEVRSPVTSLNPATS